MAESIGRGVNPFTLNDEKYRRIEPLPFKPDTPSDPFGNPAPTTESLEEQSGAQQSYPAASNTIAVAMQPAREIEQVEMTQDAVLPVEEGSVGQSRYVYHQHGGRVPEVVDIPPAYGDIASD